MTSTYIIYEIKCKDETNSYLYIGSTKCFKNRKYQHKCCTNNELILKNNSPLYVYIREHGGWNNFDMMPVEIYECNSHLECKIREQYWIELKKSQLNKFKAYISIADEIKYKNAHQKAYYEANKDKINEYNKAYNESNKDKLKEQRKEYYEANKEKKLENQKAYYEANKDKINEYNKAYCEFNKDKINEYQKEYRETNKDKLKEHRKSYKDKQKELDKARYIRNKLNQNTTLSPIL